MGFSGATASAAPPGSPSRPQRPTRPKSPAVAEPVEPQGCPADAETWRGLQICEEQPREGYDRDAFGSAYSSLEDDIIDMLPSAATPAPRSPAGQPWSPPPGHL